MRLQPGQSIGRYHILEQLGKGRKATVYKAYDTRMKRNVAIKVIRVEAFDPDMLQNVLQCFEREAKILAILSHPNIVNVFDFGEFEGSPYLVMEYIPGGMLEEGSRAAMPWPQAVQMLLPVARALAHAHSRGIVHRDIKPSHILLAHSGEPMLIDFGNAKLLEGEQDATLTGTGVGVGAPEYMAPEQGMGKPVDPRTDIYALGVVLYELVTGQRPYQADTPMAVVTKHITEPLPRPRQVNAQLPDAVERVIIKALAKEPSERYPDMMAFIAALERLAANAASASTQAGQTTQVGLETEIQPRQPGNYPTTGGSQAAGRPGTAPNLQTISTTTSTQAATRAPAQAAKRAPYLPVLLVLGAGGVLVICGAIAIFAWTRLRTNQAASATSTQAVQATTGSLAAATNPPTEPVQVFPTAAPTDPATQAATPSLEPAATEQVIVAPTPTPSSGSVKVSAMDGAEMVYVPEGTFWRGVEESMLPDLQAICDSCELRMFEDELPMKQVFVSAMWMYKTEVTNQQYAACVQAGNCKPPRDSSSLSRSSYYGNPEFANYPVVYVAWQQAANYCTWARGRLPTETEWEKAARGVDKRYFPWGNDFKRGVYNNADGVNGDTQAAGSYPAGESPYGALDMSGNVYEWVADWYDSEAYSSPITSDPGGPTSGENRVIRSGAFGFREGFSMAVFRDWFAPEDTSHNVGFRCMQVP